MTRTLSTAARILSERFHERVVFSILLMACLLPLWTSAYFLTGDGPCHLHNARVLLDWMRDQHRPFYDGFYWLNRNFEPNWFSHLALAGLLRFFEPPVAEKLFLSAYVLCFGLGWRYLIRQINPDNVFLSAVGLLFVWHKVLMMGFYNYAFSIALFFWIAGFWLRHRQAFTPGALALLAALFVLQYAAHPIGLILSGLFIGLSILTAAVWPVGAKPLRSRAKALLREALAAWVVALPAIALLAEYLFRKGLHWEANPDDFTALKKELLGLSALTTMNFRERDTGIAVGVLCVALFGWAVYQRIKKNTRQPGDALWLFLAATVLIYFKQPGGITGGLMFPERLVFIPFLVMILWAATASFPEWLRRGTLLSAVFFMAIFLVKRLPTHWEASALVAEVVECRRLIPEESVILPLNLNKNGLTPSGERIGDRIYLFPHAADYLGACRSAVMADNYEALQGYFPFAWYSEGNLYEQLKRPGSNCIIESLPPCADFVNYRNTRNGRQIDFVVLLHYQPSDFERDYGQNIKMQLDMDFVELYRSATGRVALYGRKPRR